MPYKILHGFSLIEVLVSLLLLSVSLLIFSTSGRIVLQETRANYYFHTASLLFQNMSERLHALNHQEGLERQIKCWQKEVEQLLPSGHGTVSGRYPKYVISVTWGASSEYCVQNQIGLNGCLKETVFLTMD